METRRWGGGDRGTKNSDLLVSPSLFLPVALSPPSPCLLVPLPTPLRQSLGFELEQEFLALDAAAVAGQLAVRPDHAVTWDDDRDRVAAVSRADRARGFRTADPPRQFAVTDRRAVGNLLQFGPDALLKRRAAGRKAQIELGQFACEISPQLISGLPEQSVVAPPIADRLRPAFMLLHK